MTTYGMMSRLDVLYSHTLNVGRNE